MSLSPSHAQLCADVERRELERADEVLMAPCEGCRETFTQDDFAHDESGALLCLDCAGEEVAA